MITPKDIANKTMTNEKRATAKNDYFAYSVGRPLSYLLTIPFLYLNITPNTISLLSIVPVIVGFIISMLCESKMMALVAWGLFFVWNLLDGVDGNVARYNGISSPLGSVYDAMSGYVAMVLSFFSMGIIASHQKDFLLDELCLNDDFFIILGALAGICSIFPRLVMHKIISTVGDAKVRSVQNKSSYGFIKIIALNLTSIAGIVQVLMLLAIIFELCGCFIFVYFIINFVVMLVSLYSMLKQQT